MILRFVQGDGLHFHPSIRGDNPGAMSVEDFIALALDEIEKKI